jgi:hypothetical protein
MGLISYPHTGQYQGSPLLLAPRLMGDCPRGEIFSWRPVIAWTDRRKDSADSRLPNRVRVRERAKISVGGRFICNTSRNQYFSNLKKMLKIL